MHASVPSSSQVSIAVEEVPAVSRIERMRRWLGTLGPVLITGAANDDPCAIGTYAKAGATFGFSFLWTAPLTYPMMAATVYLCSKLSMVTGQGIAGVLREHYPRWVLHSMVFSLLIANVVEAGADIGAIAASLRLFLPVPVTGITVAIALLILIMQTLGSYRLMRKVFGWLALALFAYVASAILAHPSAAEALRATISPKLVFSKAHLAMLVALIGTRLSPYMYFWQSSQTVEEQTLLERTAKVSGEHLRSTAWDVNVGMFFSNLIMYFVILSTAATLFQSGQTRLGAAWQAAEALRPLAGNAAGLLFAIGIIGAGILAVPVLTTGPAHALAEIFGWKHGLAHAPGRAPEFYVVIALSTAVAIVIGLSGFNPIMALFWASVVMGLLTPPLMLIIMLATNNRKIMGDLVNGSWVNSLGWLTTVAVTLAAGALIRTWIR